MSEGFVATADGTILRFVAEGQGLPLIFQHGLGGDGRQVAEVIDPLPGVRRLTLECRGHGGSALGPTGELSIATFAEDVAALVAGLGIDTAVVGGISMGAAIALRLAVTKPSMVKALILARPAWIVEPAPDTMRPYQEVAELMRRHAVGEARTLFARSATARKLAASAPDNLATLMAFFDKPTPGPLAAVLAAIAADGPGVSLRDLQAIRTPTLVIAHAADEVHPLAYAHALAGAIPGANLVEITPKAVDRGRYARDLRKSVVEFLGEVSC